MKLKNNTAKRATWAVTFFYLLIAFEFFYMATPFAIYFYSVYQPGLEIIEEIPVFAWMNQFFLPHIAEQTKSFVIDNLRTVGSFIFIGGLGVFLICAAQVYYNKIFKKGIVSGGLYRYIRHPQYTGFAISSFGMLLIWPRFLVLVTFVTMLFVYYFLAKIEERECDTKFGQSYSDYKKRTYMFLPFKLSFRRFRFFSTLGKAQRYLIYIGIYVVSICIAVVLATVIRSASVDMLYTTYDDRAVCFSITKNDDVRIKSIMDIAFSDERVDSVVSEMYKDQKLQFINYILPVSFFHISEIPMNIPNYEEFNLPVQSKDENKVKVVFTQAILSSAETVKSKNILLHTHFTRPIIEVWIDVSVKKITNILMPSKDIRYKNIPVPVF